MPGKIPVSVIIVSFNTKDLTRKALSALYNSSKLPEQVIVVDNDSKDNSAEMIKAEFPQVILIESKENLGFAKANNRALRETANQPYAWLLNSDTETGRNSLEQLLVYMKAHQEVGAAGPQLVYPDGSLQSTGGFFPGFCNVFNYLIPYGFLLPEKWRRKMKSIAVFPQVIPDAGLELDYATGAALFVRKQTIEEAGLLPEDYFMYFEETEMCYKMKQKGWKIKALNTEPVMHVYGGSFKTKYDPRRLKIFMDSLKIFVRRNYRGRKKNCILTEIFLLGWLSLAIKKIKSWL
jgi:N-acetylglucosaminyl-diphospho-decaprenol L-rhamnosyltransferase